MLMCATTTGQHWENPPAGISNYFIFPFLLIMASYLKFSFLPWFFCVAFFHGNSTECQKYNFQFPSTALISQVITYEAEQPKTQPRCFGSNQMLNASLFVQLVYRKINTKSPGVAYSVASIFHSVCKYNTLLSPHTYFIALMKNREQNSHVMVTMPPSNASQGKAEIDLAGMIPGMQRQYRKKHVKNFNCTRLGKTHNKEKLDCLQTSTQLE